MHSFTTTVGQNSSILNAARAHRDNRWKDHRGGDSTIILYINRDKKRVNQVGVVLALWHGLTLNETALAGEHNTS